MEILNYSIDLEIIKTCIILNIKFRIALCLCSLLLSSFFLKDSIFIVAIIFSLFFFDNGFWHVHPHSPQRYGSNSWILGYEQIPQTVRLHGLPLVISLLIDSSLFLISKITFIFSSRLFSKTYRYKWLLLVLRDLKKKLEWIILIKFYFLKTKS